MEWFSTLVGRSTEEKDKKEDPPNDAEAAQPVEEQPNPTERRGSFMHSHSNLSDLNFADLKKDLMGDEDELPIYKRFEDRWYGKMLSSLPQLIGIDLIFVGFLFLWRIGTPDNAAYIAAGCVVAIFGSLAVSLILWKTKPLFVSMAIAMGMVL